MCAPNGAREMLERSALFARMCAQGRVRVAQLLRRRVVVRPGGVESVVRDARRQPPLRVRQLCALHSALH